MKTLKLFSVLLIFTTVSCVTSSVERGSNMNGKIIQNEQLQSKINSALAEITIERIEYKAEAYVWRDFMPGPGDVHTGLMSGNYLIRTDHQEIPDYIEMVKQYVIKDNSIWVSNYDKGEHPSAYPYKQVRVSRNGPKWEVGIEVEIGIKVLNRKTNKEFFIKVTGEKINKTS